MSHSPTTASPCGDHSPTRFNRGGKRHRSLSVPNEVMRGDQRLGAAATKGAHGRASNIRRFARGWSPQKAAASCRVHAIVGSLLSSRSDKASSIQFGAVMLHSVVDEVLFRAPSRSFSGSEDDFECGRPPCSGKRSRPSATPRFKRNTRSWHSEIGRGASRCSVQLFLSLNHAR
jgi:hypothetical protein